MKLSGNWALQTNECESNRLPPFCPQGCYFLVDTLHPLYSFVQCWLVSWHHNVGFLSPSDFSGLHVCGFCLHKREKPIVLLGPWLNRNSCRGFGRPNETLTLFKTKDVNFATLSKRKCCNFLPCSRLHISLHFHILQRRRTKSAKFMWLKGENRRKSAGTTLFKTKMLNCTPCLRQRTLEVTPWLLERPYIGNTYQPNIWHPWYYQERKLHFV